MTIGDVGIVDYSGVIPAGRLYVLCYQSIPEPDRLLRSLREEHQANSYLALRIILSPECDVTDVRDPLLYRPLVLPDLLDEPIYLSELNPEDGRRHLVHPVVHSRERLDRISEILLIEDAVRST